MKNAPTLEGWETFNAPIQNEFSTPLMAFKLWDGGWKGASVLSSNWKYYSTLTLFLIPESILVHKGHYRSAGEFSPLMVKDLSLWIPQLLTPCVG